MFIGNTGGIELGLELTVEDFLEQVLEAAIIGFEDGVFGRQIDRIFPLQTIVEAGAGETDDALVEVIHAHGHTTGREVEDLMGDFLAAIGRLECHGQLTGAGHDHVGGAILVTKGMAADDHRLVPCRHDTRHVADDDRLAEDGTAENVADGPVR